MNKPEHPAQFETQDGPSLFVGIALEVEEILLCERKLALPCGELRAGMTGRYESEVKKAADDIAKIAGQMQTLSAHLSTVIARHQSRKPRA